MYFQLAICHSDNSQNPPECLTVWVEDKDKHLQYVGWPVGAGNVYILKPKLENLAAEYYPSLELWSRC